MKQIVPNDNCLTPDQILRYLQDESSPAEMRLIDRHIEQCSMCSDAIEGSMQLPVSQLEHSYSNIQAKISDAIQLKTAEKPIMQVVHRATKRYWLMGAAASVALLVTAGVWFFQNKNEEIKAVAATESAMKKDMSPITTDSSLANYAIVDMPKSESKAGGNANVATIPKGTNSPISQAESSIKTNETPPNTVTSPAPSDYAAVQKPKASIAKDKTDDKATDEKSITQEYERQKGRESETALKTKMADVETKPAFDISNNPQGNKAETNENSKATTASAPTTAPNQNNYPGAATQNVVIPDVKRSGADYSMAAKKQAKAKESVKNKDEYDYLKMGIGFYNEKKYDTAIGNFNRIIAVESSGENYEKALWYLANAYLKKGEKTTAHTLFTRIIAEKGQFSKQAATLLKE